MNCLERSEEINRLNTIRIVVKAARCIIRDCAFPIRGPLSAGTRKAGTPTARRAEQKASGRPDKGGIEEGGLVADRREAYEVLASLFERLAALRGADETDEATLEKITRFMDALRRGRSITGPAKALCKSLHDSYQLDKKVDFPKDTKILLDHDDYYDGVPCFPGAAAYEHFYLNRDRKLTSQDIVDEVAPCRGSVDALDEKLAKLHPDQQKRLKGFKRGGRFFARP